MPGDPSHDTDGRRPAAARSSRGRSQVFCLASAVFLIAVLALWVHSRLWTIGVVFFSRTGQLDAVAAEHHGLLLLFSDIPGGNESALAAQPAYVPAKEFQSQVHNWLFDVTRDNFHVAGFHLASGIIDPSGMRAAYSAVLVPYWVPAIALAVLPARLFARLYLLRLRNRRGQCLNCGYDLRHSAQRCPECGTLRGARAASPFTSPWSRRIKLSAGATILILMTTVGVLVWGAMKRGRDLQSNAWERSAVACGLDRRVAELVVPMGADAREIIELLRRQARTAIDVDWPALDSQPAGRAFRTQFHHPVEQRLRDMTLATLLEVFLNGDTVPDGGHVLISTPLRLPRFVRAYDLGDLLPQVDRRTEAEEALYGTASHTDREKLDLIVKVMTDCVLSDQWRVNGGQIGNEWIIGHWLVVEHNELGHREVARFLATLRAPAYDWRRAIDLRPTVSERANPERRIAELDLYGVTGVQAIEMIARQSSCNIVVHLRDFVAFNNMLMVRSWMRLSDVSVGQALDVLLIDAAFGYIASGYVAHDNLIEVYCDNLPPPTELRVYDVHDLIDEVITYRRQRALPRPPLPPLMKLISDSPPDGAPKPEEMADTIRVSLMDTVSRESWRDYGGAVGGIYSIGGALLVQQTAENHRRIAAVLRDLRAGGSKDGAEVSSH